MESTEKETWRERHGETWRAWRVTSKERAALHGSACFFPPYVCGILIAFFPESFTPSISEKVIRTDQSLY